MDTLFARALMVVSIQSMTQVAQADTVFNLHFGGRYEMCREIMTALSECPSRDLSLPCLLPSSGGYKFPSWEVVSDEVITSVSKQQRIWQCQDHLPHCPADFDKENEEVVKGNFKGEVADIVTASDGQSVRLLKMLRVRNTRGYTQRNIYISVDESNHYVPTQMKIFADEIFIRQGLMYTVEYGYGSEISAQINEVRLFSSKGKPQYYVSDVVCQINAGQVLPPNPSLQADRP